MTTGKNHKFYMKSHLLSYYCMTLSVGLQIRFYHKVFWCSHVEIFILLSNKARSREVIVQSLMLCMGVFFPFIKIFFVVTEAMFLMWPFQQWSPRVFHWIETAVRSKKIFLHGRHISAWFMVLRKGKGKLQGFFLSYCARAPHIKPVKAVLWKK